MVNMLDSAIGMIWQCDASNRHMLNPSLTNNLYKWKIRLLMWGPSKRVKKTISILKSSTMKNFAASSAKIWKQRYVYCMMKRNNSLRIEMIVYCSNLCLLKWLIKKDDFKAQSYSKFKLWCRKSFRTV